MRNAKKKTMKVRECMTREVRFVDPSETLQVAARLMAEIDAGFLPVGENDQLVGIITDRDIAIRAVGMGLASDARVRDVMSHEIRCCHADDDVDDILDCMAVQQIRRLPVVNRDKRLVGVISIGDLAIRGEASRSGETLGEIVRRNGLHSQVIWSEGAA
jgi:CBS domain-containing protein